MDDMVKSPVIDRVLTLEIVRASERAAVAAARLRGRGDEQAADEAAMMAMRDELTRLHVTGRVIICEGMHSQAHFLESGKKFGLGEKVTVDIACSALEGTTLCAKALPNALSVIAMGEKDCFLNVPGVYMNKIAIGPGYDPGLVDLDAPVADNLKALASAKDVSVKEITVCILDRPRHFRLIEDVRAAGASIQLIGDGDIAGVIHTSESDSTGIDMYMGMGGAAEGVLAAAAMRCTGGQMQGRLLLENNDHRRLAAKAGIEDINRKYELEDLASGDVIFAATGVTTGSLLSGVRFSPNGVATNTVVMRSSSRTVRWIRTEHRNRVKFD